MAESNDNSQKAVIEPKKGETAPDTEKMLDDARWEMLRAVRYGEQFAHYYRNCSRNASYEPWKRVHPFTFQEFTLAYHQTKAEIDAFGPQANDKETVRKYLIVQHISQNRRENGVFSKSSDERDERMIGYEF